MDEPGYYVAEGHNAKIFIFDEETMMLPLNQDQARRLSVVWRNHIRRLKATGDWPEEEADSQLLRNLKMVETVFIVEAINRKKRPTQCWECTE